MSELNFIEDDDALLYAIINGLSLKKDAYSSFELKEMARKRLEDDNKNNRTVSKIKRLEYVNEGHVVNKDLNNVVWYTRLPNEKEMMDKINEIIDYLNMR